MSKFKLIGTQSEVPGKGEKSTDGLPEVRVVKLDNSDKPTVRDFSANTIVRAGVGDYSVTKAKYGALFKDGSEPSATTAPGKKAQHFTISPLLREPLAIEAEERRIIEEKAQNRVKELSETLLPEAKARGYEMGLAKGHAEAFQRFKEEADVRISRLDQLLTEFEGAKSSIFQANERFLMDMIYRISKMILLRELTTDKQYILRLVSEALNHVGAKEHIHIRVHPRDLETIGLIQDEVRKKLGDVKNIQIDEDPTLESGGCKMETEWSYLDSSVDTQLKRLFDALFTPEVT